MVRFDGTSDYAIGAYPNLLSSPILTGRYPRDLAWQSRGCGGCLGRLSRQGSAANGSKGTPKDIIALKLPYEFTVRLLSMD